MNSNRAGGRNWSASFGVLLDAHLGDCVTLLHAESSESISACARSDSVLSPLLPLPSPAPRVCRLVALPARNVQPRRASRRLRVPQRADPRPPGPARRERRTTKGEKSKSSRYVSIPTRGTRSSMSCERTEAHARGSCHPSPISSSTVSSSSISSRQSMMHGSPVRVQSELLADSIVHVRVQLSHARR